MKTRTKLLTAVLSTVTALSCALTAAAAGTTPTITLQGNETAPITLENGTTSQATLVLKATDFSTVAGADITLTLPENGKVTLTNATVADSKGNWTLTENENYKIDLANRIIKFVDVFNVDSDDIDSLELKLTFTVSDGTIGSHKIGITADLAADDTKLFGDGEKTVTEGYIVIGREKTKYTKADINADTSVKSGEFIPAYGAYTGDYANPSYITKNSNGKFDVDALAEDTEINVLKCKLPDEGKDVTTFGSSKKVAKPESSIDYEKSNGIQFGSYVPTTADATKYGTFVVIGNYDAFKAYYKSNKPTVYPDDASVLNKITELYDEKVNDETKFLKLSYGSEFIYVGKTTQTKYMWQGDNSELQYALRVYKVNEAETYTAIGYSLNSVGYNFSNEIQTAVYNTMP